MRKVIVVILGILVIVIVVAFAFNPEAQTSSIQAAPQVANSAVVAFVVLIAGILVLATLVLLFLSKSSYNVFGSGSITHTVNVQHRYYNDGEDVSMDEETKSWLNKSS